MKGMNNMREFKQLAQNPTSPHSRDKTRITIKLNTHLHEVGKLRGLFSYIKHITFTDLNILINKQYRTTNGHPYQTNTSQFQIYAYHNKMQHHLTAHLILWYSTRVITEGH